MNTRCIAAASLFVVAMAVQASASILSASNPTGQVRAGSTDRFNLSTVQDGMNAALAEKAQAARYGSLVDGSPAIGNTGGFLVQTGSRNVTVSGDAAFSSSGRHGGYGFDSHDNNLFGRHNNNSGVRGNNRGGRGGRGGNDDRGRRGGGGTHATPEPSTWMLLGVGLAMLGVYAGMRRRQTSSI